MGACSGSHLSGKENRFFTRALENVSLRVTRFGEGASLATSGEFRDSRPNAGVIVEVLRKQMVGRQEVHDYEFLEKRPTLGSMEVYVKAQRIDLCFWVEPTDAVGLLRPMVWESAGIQPSMQRLWWSGFQLDCSRTFKQYEIPQKATIFVIMKMPKSHADPSAGNLRSAIATLDSRYSEVIPEFREVRPGFSVKTTCANTECKAHNRFVYINKGFGVFDIARETCRVQCPACQQKARVNRYCGFYRCRWKWEGELSDHVDRTGKGRTSRFQYVLFSEADRDDWVYLRVVVDLLRESNPTDSTA